MSSRPSRSIPTSGTWPPETEADGSFWFNAETEGIAFDSLNRHELGDTLFDS